MAKKIGIIIGAVFVVIGLIGFISNPVVGSSDSLFATNTAHDIVHVLTGLILIGIAMSRVSKLGTALKTFGIIYLAVAIFGFFAVNAGSGTGMVFSLLEVNTASNWLHVVLSIVLFAAGVVSSKDNGASVNSQTSQAPTMNA